MFWQFNKKKKEQKLAEFEWVKKVIDSCETVEQTKCSKNLVQLWEDRYNDQSLSQQLRDRVVNKILNL